MKSKKIVSFLVVISCLFPGILWADFTEGNLFVVNQPSSGSAGYDFILEFSPQGSNLGTLIPQSLHILGMRDLAFDPVSGHLFYTVSSWTEQIFEIREIDENGILVHTYTHSDFGSGNIELVFDRAGNLFVANDDFIYNKETGSIEIIQLFELPYTGIGDLEMDHHGNLYVANTHPSAPATIVKLDPLGNAALFASDISFQPIITDMVIDVDGVLYASCRFNDTILKFDADGNWTTFADEEDTLHDPASMAFIIFPATCTTDFDEDGDVDGSDLTVLAAGYGTSYDEDDLSAFAEEFGRTDCLGQ